jgi:hypothetical protein
MTTITNRPRRRDHAVTPAPRAMQETLPVQKWLRAKTFWMK